jgi:hypothetical protein
MPVPKLGRSSVSVERLVELHDLAGIGLLPSAGWELGKYIVRERTLQECLNEIYLLGHIALVDGKSEDEADGVPADDRSVRVVAID